MSNDTIQATELLVLPQDIIMIPVDKLQSSIQAQLSATPGEFAVTRRISRVPSKVVNSSSADFIRQFRSPTTFIDAVMRASKVNNEEPKKLLKAVLPLVKRFKRDRLLVPSNSEDTETIRPKFKRGDFVDLLEILRPIQAYEDVEVYQVIDPDGTVLALKIVRRASDKKGREMLENEAAIGQQLDGKVNPKFHTSSSFQGRFYFTTEWVPGVDAAAIASEYRDLGILGSRHKLLELCTGIVRAYAHLHQQKTIHSDVHPRNILVSEEGDITIIDYGLARTDPKILPTKLHRGGVAYYFEPEYAAARRCGLSPPISTREGEQYSIAALLYFLITGKHYLKFSLEKEEMLRQIEQDPPLHFEAYELQPWPQMERVLAKALSKQPEERFPSLDKFARELEKVAVEDRYVGNENGVPRSGSLGDRLISNQKQMANTQTFSELFEEVSRLDGKVFDELHEGSSASVTFGAAGIAYALYRLSCLRGDAELLAIADLWINKALTFEDKSEAFYHRDFDLNPNTLGPISLYYNPIGIHYVRAMISQALGDEISLQESLQNYIKSANLPCDNPDLNLGKSGIVLGYALLADRLPQNQSLLQEGNKMLSEIWKQIDQFDAIGCCSNFPNLGIAHGWAGVLYAALRWHQVTGQPFPASLPERLEQLAALAEPWENGIRWPANQPDGKRVAKYLSWWCGGSAGLLHLWTLACELFSDDIYLELAEKTAWHVYKDSSQIGDLCCGLSGRAYALLSLYKRRGKQQWLLGAKDLAQKAITSTGLAGRRRFSLYKGGLGVALLFEDLAVPEKSCMPLFERD